EPIINAELDRLRREPPTAKELERALAKFEKGKYSRLTPLLGRAVTLALGFAEKDDPADYRRDFARYFRVKPDDLRRVARRYLPADRVRLEVVPSRPGQPRSEAVSAGPTPGGDDGPPPPDRRPKGGPDWSVLPGPSEPKPFRAPRVVRARLQNGLDV